MMRRSPAPWVALALTLLLTLAATLLIRQVAQNRDDVRFANARNRTVSQIRFRVQAYLAGLRAAEGFFAASATVDRDEFREYVAHLDLQAHYPGIQGIGFAERVPASRIGDVEEDARLEGRPTYQVWPKEPIRPEYFPIVYLQPMDRRNLAALGYDMFSDSVRREAMERARDTGEAALSGRVRLVQELDDEHPQPGFLIYQPVYEGAVPESVAERRKKLEGFVYSPFRAYDLFRAVLVNVAQDGLAVRLYDGEVTDTSRLLYDSAPERPWEARSRWPAVTDTMTVAGRLWTLSFAPTPAFAARSDEPLVPLIAAIGLVASLVMFRMTRGQVDARAKAERSEAMRTRFFAMMSHELRTPINAILGYNDLLLSGVYGEMPPPQAYGVERAQKAARHLAELVNDVLDLSKIEAGKLHLEPDEVHVGQVMDDLLTTIGPLAEERECELVVTPCTYTHAIMTDPRRLRQILLNLLSNATKFGSGQPIYVGCGEAEDGGVAIEIRDGGPGIHAEDLDRIFEEFVQLDPGTREGTGLGLPISRRLTALLGGRLTADSIPGGGSTFRLWLPARLPHL